MHPKIVLVVSRTHWRCLACKLLNKRVVSIDQHLDSVHPEVACLLSSLTSASRVDSCCLSDGELDTTLRWDNTVFPVRNLPSSENKKEKGSQNTRCLQGNSTEPVGRASLRNLKKKTTRKSRQKSVKQQRETSVKDSKISDRRSDEDDVPEEEDNMFEDENKTEEEELTQTQGTFTRSKVLRQKRLGSSQTRQNVSNVKVKKERSTSAKNVSVSKPLKQKSLPIVDGISSDCKQKNKKQERSLKVNFKEIFKSEPIEMKEEMSISESAPSVMETSSFEKEPPVKMRRVKKSRKTVTMDRLSKQLNKSNIATSCVPWLLDSGRKAGDKVTKKPRRTLLPEEKQAVRELYGICTFQHMADRVALPIPEEDSHPFHGMENQSMTVSENFSTHHPNQTASVQRAAREDDAATSHRNYMMNMFSSGTRDFFVDNTRTSESLYPGYSGVYPQPQNHHPHYVPQTSEFYAPVPNILSQRSSMSCSQGYGQTDPQVLPTAGAGDVPRSHMEGGSYQGQGFSMASLPQPHGLSASVSSTHVPSHAMQSSAHDNYSFNTKPAPDSQPSASVSAPESCHQRKPVLDSNPDNERVMCKEHVQYSNEYESHGQKDGSFQSFECKRCRCKLHGMHELNLHVFSVHETEKQGFCFLCNQDMSGMESLEKHVHKHAYGFERQLTEMRFHDCRLCCEELHSSYKIIRTHYYQHHVAHVCSDCHQVFKDTQDYKDHIRTHKGRPVLCSICGSKFESVEDLEKHSPCSEDIWAEDGKGDQCFKCGLWCPNRAVVEAHRKQHRSQEDVEAYRKGAKVGFPCVSCEKVFKNKHACRRHIKMVHEGVSCYKHYCEYCGKGFLTKGHMRDHIALHHLKIKRYTCDYCEQQFVCGPTLRRHVRKEHTKHKPYQCQHCGERFFEKTPLQRHLTLHTGLAPFMCEHCGKGFYTKHSFTNHGSTHSTVKEFVCTGCQKGFTRKYNLQAHRKICKML